MNPNQPDNEDEAQKAKRAELQDRLNAEAMTTRNVRFIVINPSEFLSLFTKGLVFAKRTQILDGVPEDAVVIGMTVDHVRGGIVLTVQSDQYEPVPMTKMPPVQEVAIKLGVDGATKKKRK